MQVCHHHQQPLSALPCQSLLSPMSLKSWDMEVLAATCIIFIESKSLKGKIYMLWAEAAKIGWIRS